MTNYEEYEEDNKVIGLNIFKTDDKNKKFVNVNSKKAYLEDFVKKVKEADARGIELKDVIEIKAYDIEEKDLKKLNKNKENEEHQI